MTDPQAGGWIAEQKVSALPLWRHSIFFYIIVFNAHQEWVIGSRYFLKQNLILLLLCLQTFPISKPSAWCPKSLPALSQFIWWVSPADPPAMTLHTLWCCSRNSHYSPNLAPTLSLTTLSWSCSLYAYSWPCVFLVKSCPTSICNQSQPCSTSSLYTSLRASRWAPGRMPDTPEVHRKCLWNWVEMNWV